MGVIQAIFFFLRAFILGRAGTAIENLALRQQQTVFKPCRVITVDDDFPDGGETSDHRPVEYVLAVG